MIDEKDGRRACGAPPIRGASERRRRYRLRWLCPETMGRERREWAPTDWGMGASR